MSATVAAALKKIAVALISNPKVLKTIFGIILGIIVIIIMPIAAVLGIFSGDIEINTDELHQQIVAEVGSQYDAVLTAIENELKTQGVEIDPTKAQVIYLYALSDREKDNPNFYSDFAACFKGAADDDAIYANITEKFGVAFTDEDKQKLGAMIEKAIKSQMLDPKGFHNEIAELVKDDQTPLAGGDYTSPYRSLNWKDCITSGYGKRVDPVTGEEGVAHTGLDLAAPFGTEIYPVKSGTVLYVRNSSEGFGNHLAVNHGGGVVTLYGHCSEVLVKEGDAVTTDTVIAKVGSTGKSTGNHCHLEIVIKGQPVNPTKYLK